MENLNTGDILLFESNSKGLFGLLSSLIKLGTSSNYTHVGMVLSNPTFINEDLKGLYLWESVYDGKPDPQDGKIKLGVKLTPLEQVFNEYKNGHIYLRKIKFNCSNSKLKNFKDFVNNISRRNVFNKEKLLEIHNVVYDKPYDIVPLDWLEALFNYDSNPQKISRFWCSALLGYIYTKLGILKKNTDWSKMKPCDFSEDLENLNYTGFCKLDSQIKIL